METIDVCYALLVSQWCLLFQVQVVAQNLTTESPAVAAVNLTTVSAALNVTSAAERTTTPALSVTQAPTTATSDVITTEDNAATQGAAVTTQGGITTQTSKLNVTSAGLVSVTSPKAQTTVAANTTPATAKRPRHLLLDTPCKTDEQCRQQHFASKCYDVAEAPGWRRCGCDHSVNYYKHRDSCGGLCAPDVTRCVTSGSVCMASRCVCEPHLYHVTVNGTSHCGVTLSQSMDPACTVCIANDGTCVDLDGDKRMDHCSCPVSRSGPNCATIHVHVKCKVAEDVMRVCYTPHQNVFFTKGSLLRTYHGGNNIQCQGFKDEAECGPAGYRIDLALSGRQMTTCHTRKFQMESIKFENKLVVQKQMEVMSSSDFIFKTYCLFKTHVDISFPGFGVDRDGWTSAGVANVPTVQLNILSGFNKPIPDNMFVNLGDHIRLQLAMTSDGSYSALYPKTCIISSSAVFDDPTAFFVRIIDKGCPAHGQFIITGQNMFKKSGTIYETGLVRVFKISDADVLFLHCQVTLCLRGKEAPCQQPACTGTQRSKREVDGSSETALATRTLLVKQEEQSVAFHTSSGEFVSTAVILSALAIAAGVAMGVVCSVHHKLLKKAKPALWTYNQRTIKF